MSEGNPGSSRLVIRLPPVVPSCSVFSFGLARPRSRTHVLHHFSSSLELVFLLLSQPYLARLSNAGCCLVAADAAS